MNHTVATLLVLGIGVYLSLGLLFALAFVTKGVGRIDPQAKGGTWGFRVLIAPGACALWPLLLVRWWHGTPPPIERNPHRDAALASKLSSRTSGEGA